MNARGCPRVPNGRPRAVASIRTAARILVMALVSQIATLGQSRAFEQLFECSRLPSCPKWPPKGRRNGPCIPNGCRRVPNRRPRAVARTRTAGGNSNSRRELEQQARTRTAVRVLATALVSRMATPGQSRAFELLFEFSRRPSRDTRGQDRPLRNGGPHSAVSPPHHHPPLDTVGHVWVRRRRAARSATLCRAERSISVWRCLNRRQWPGGRVGGNDP